MASQSPTSSVEDGPIPPFRGPNINTTNPVIIVRIPDELRKPGEPRYQLATNPLSTEKVTSDLPATLLLRSMLPNAERNADNNSQRITENISPELNMSAGELDTNENFQMNHAPQGRSLPQETYSQGNLEDGGGFGASYSTSPSANFMEPQGPSPWIDGQPFSFQQRMLPLEQPHMQPPLIPFPPPHCNFGPCPPLMMNPDFRPRFELRRDFSPNRNQAMQRPFVRQQLDRDQDFSSRSEPTRRHGGRRNFRGSNRFFKKSSGGYRGYH